MERSGRAAKPVRVVSGVSNLPVESSSRRAVTPEFGRTVAELQLGKLSSREPRRIKEFSCEVRVARPRHWKPPPRLRKCTGPGQKRAVRAGHGTANG
jgi:hypothetical protein